MSILLKEIYSIIPIKVSTAEENSKNLNETTERETETDRQRTAKAMLNKKNKTESITLSGFKSY